VFIPRASPCVGGDEVELRGHRRHRVDLPDQRGDAQALHDRVAGHLQLDRTTHRNDQLVDKSHLFLRVEEDPLPIETDHLDLERILPQLLVRIEPLGDAPQADRHEEDHDDGKPPHGDFQPKVGVPIGPVAIPRLLPAVAEEDERERDEGGNDGDAGEDHHVIQVIELRPRDRAGRLQKGLRNGQLEVGVKHGVGGTSGGGWKKT